MTIHDIIVEERNGQPAGRPSNGPNYLDLRTNITQPLHCMLTLSRYRLFNGDIHLLYPNWQMYLLLFCWRTGANQWWGTCPNLFFSSRSSKCSGPPHQSNTRSPDDPLQYLAFAYLRLEMGQNGRGAHQCLGGHIFKWFNLLDENLSDHKISFLVG